MSLYEEYVYGKRTKSQFFFLLVVPLFIYEVPSSNDGYNTPKVSKVSKSLH